MNTNGINKRINELERRHQPATKLEVIQKVDQVGQPVATILFWGGRAVKTLAPGLWDAI